MTNIVAGGGGLHLQVKMWRKLKTLGSMWLSHSQIFSISRGAPPPHLLDGIIIPVEEHRDSGDSGGTGIAHLYGETPDCGHQERPRVCMDV